jgi:mono/diheme cytochrome c family protein
MVSRVFSACALLTLSACVTESSSETTGALSFNMNCAVCHGDSGRGDGPMAAGLSPPPADLTVLSRNNGGVFPRDYVMSTIDGYRRGDRFSDAMPAFGAGDLGPTVIVEGEDGIGTPVPSGLLVLADYLETIQRD